MIPDIKAFYDRPSGTVSYVVAVPDGKHCAVIDPVLDFDPGSGRTGTEAAEQIVAYVLARDLTADWILETDLHGDHLTAAPFLKDKVGGQIAAGRGMLEAAACYGTLFPEAAGQAQAERAYDHLFQDGERFHIGAMPADALLTPGPSPASAAYGVGDVAFVGDVLLMPDCGTGRTDLPGGDPAALYRSVQRLLALPGHSEVYPGHDFPPDGRAPAWQTTVATQRLDNLLLIGPEGEAAFVERRRGADRALAVPERFLAAIQANLRAGRLPPAGADGVRRLSLPLDAF